MPVSAWKLTIIKNMYFFQCSGEVWDKIFEVNVKNSLQLTQLVLPHMRKRKGGSIVYISTVGAFQSNNMYDRDAEGLNALGTQKNRKIER